MGSCDTFLLFSCGGTGLRQEEGTPALGDTSLHKKGPCWKTLSSPCHTLTYFK